MFLGREQHHVGEHIKGLHDTDGVQALLFRLQHVFLDKQLLALKGFGGYPGGIHIKAETLIDMVILAPRHQGHAVKGRCRRVDTDARISDKPRIAMGDQRVGHKLQIAVFFDSQVLNLRGVVGVHGVHFGRRLGGDMPAGAHAHVHIRGQTVALEHATRGRDHGHTGQLRQCFVPVQGPLHQ